MESKSFEQKFHQPLELSDTQITKLIDLENPKFQHIFESFLDPILIPRVPGTENHEKVKKFVVDKMEEFGWNVELDEFEETTPLGCKSFTNIIATLNPDIPQRLLLACHYDSKYGIKDENGDEFIGAVDSGVSCCMLLYLAHLFREKKLLVQNQISSNITLQFVFFDGEEAFIEWTKSDSLYGSRHLAKKWKNLPYQFNCSNTGDYLDRINLFLLLDLLGLPNPKFYSFFDETFQLHNFLVDIEKSLHKLGLWNGPRSGTYFQKRKYTGNGPEDDHLPFVELGVKNILHVVPYPIPKVWHTMGDNKYAIDYPTIQNLINIVLVFVTSYLRVPL